MHPLENFAPAITLAFFWTYVLAVTASAMAPGKSQVPLSLNPPLLTSASAVVLVESAYILSSTRGFATFTAVNSTLGVSSLKPNFTDAILFPVEPLPFCLLERQDKCVMHCNNGTCVFCTLALDAPWYFWESCIGHAVGIIWYLFKLWVLVGFVRFFSSLSPSLIPWSFCILAVCGLLMICTPLDRTVGCKPDLPGPLEDYGESDAFLCSTSTKYYELFRVGLFGSGLRASRLFGLGLEKNFALMYWSPVDYTTCSPKTCRFDAQSSDSESEADTEEEDWDNRPMAWRLSRDNPQLTPYYDALYDAFEQYEVTVYFADSSEYANLDLGLLDCLIRVDFGGYEQDWLGIGVGPQAFIRACGQVGVRPRYQTQGFLGLLLPQTVGLEFLEKTGLFVAQMLVSTTRKQKFLNFLVYASNLVSLCQHYELSSANIQWLIDGSKDLSSTEPLPKDRVHVEKKNVVDSIFDSFDPDIKPRDVSHVNAFAGRRRDPYQEAVAVDERVQETLAVNSVLGDESQEDRMWRRRREDGVSYNPRVSYGPYDVDSAIRFNAQGFVDDFAAVLGSSVVVSSLKIISLVWVLLFVVPSQPRDMLGIVDSTLHWKTPLDVGLSVSTSVLKHFLLLAKRTTAFFATGDWRSFVINDTETGRLETALDALDIRVLELDRLPEYGLDLAMIEQDAQELLPKVKLNLSVSPGLDSKRLQLRLDRFIFNCHTQMRGLESRPAPLGVMFTGGAGIGKSKILDLFKMNFANWKPTNQDLNLKNVYSRTQGESFWSGFKSSHWAIVYDDLAQEHTKMLGPGVNPVGELLNVINNAPYFPAMAGVEEKGTVSVNALLVLVTTNNDGLNLHYTAAHPGATKRRLQYCVIPQVRPQFRKEGQMMIDPSKCVREDGSPELDCWTFTVHVYEERSTSQDYFIYDELTDMNGGDFWALMHHFTMKHFAGQGRSRNFTEAANSVKHCTCCKVPMTMCSRPRNKSLEAWIKVDAGRTTRTKVAKDDASEIQPVEVVAQVGEICETYPELFYKYGFVATFLAVLAVWFLSTFFVEVLATFGFIGAAYIFWRVAQYDGFLPLFSLVPFMTAVGFFFLWLRWSVFPIMSILSLCLMLFVVSRIRVYDSKIETIMIRTYAVWTLYTGFMNVVTFTCDCFEYSRVRALQWWWWLRLGEVREMTLPKFNWRNMSRQRWSATAMVVFVLFVCASTMIWSRVFDPLIAQGGETKEDPEIKEVPKNPWVVPDRIALSTVISRSSACGVRMDLEHKLTTTARMEFRRAGGGGGFCYAIPLVGSSWLAPSHVVKEAQALGVPLELTMGRQSWRWNPHSSTVVHHPKEEYSVIHVVGVPVADNLRFIANTSRLGEQSFDGTVNYPRLGFSQFASLGRTLGQLERNSYTQGTVWGFSGRLQADTELGDCGVPLISKAGTSIMGIHIGGSGKLAFFSSLDPIWIGANVRKDVAAQSGVLLGLANGCSYQSLVDVPYKSPFRWEPLNQKPLPHVVVGQVDTRVQRFVSRVGPTMFTEFWSNYYTTSKMRPKVGVGDSPEAPLWKIKTNFLVSASQERDLFQVDALLAAVQSLRAQLSKLDWAKWRVLDHEQTMYGVPQENFCRGMKFSTSAGIPYCKAKHLVMDYNSDTGRFDMTQEQMLRVAFMESNAKQGLIPGLLFRATLKDEPIKLEKLLKGKIRIFQASSLESTYLMRKYFLAAGAVLCQDFRASEVAVGMNCHGDQWDQLHRHMFEDGWKSFCGDYSNFDQNMSSGVLFEAWSLVISLGNLSDEDKRVCLSLATDASHPLTDFFGDLVRLSGTNPSGHSMTVIINGIVNSIYMRYAYFKLHGQCDDFNDLVKMVTYGDDNIVSVHPSRQATFNQRTVSQALATICVGYTDANKSLVVPDFTDPKEYSFLKRSWVKNGDIWLAPLEEDSIGKMLLVGIASDAEIERHVSILRSSCLEMFHFGRARYDEHVSRIRDLVVWLQTQGPEHQALAIAIGSVDFLSWDERLEKRNAPGGTSWFDGTDGAIEELVFD